ncbi:FAD/NAD-P-binding domain-containing protein [Calocera viscosa TUFC12733]|uniref:L-ornithine N(5)-monooxygenase [NAD(P)H] n=1 Tax=Calocera viscosa (strain TUFC12733) TaxID=1330018 RepID=A0A167JDX1_CALVF|nr:FAD/NAD-P-binding domain-containing protein [Calocera viscosa TUFC12733]
MTDPRVGLVGIIGAGAAGLITGHVLLKDGFKVELLTRDKSPGGVWAAKRVYPGLSINNVHGEFRFSALPMPPPAHARETGGRLSGFDMQLYMEKFADTFLNDSIRYGVEVEDISLDTENQGYVVTVTDLRTGELETLRYRRIVLCSGGCSNPHVPSKLSVTTANKAGFLGHVIHSQQFGERIDEILAACEGATGCAVVVGGGKSAQDIAAYLANQGKKVGMVFESTDAILAYPIPLPDFIRRSRVLGIMSPSPYLRSRLERFLHQTWLGSKIVRGFWATLTAFSFRALGIPSNSPLRRAQDLFWSIRTNDEGVGGRERFHALVNNGKIDLIAPARAVSFGSDGRSIILNDGRVLPADAVIMATGYQSSWTKLFNDRTMDDIGLARHPPGGIETQIDVWKCASLTTPPASHDAGEQWASSLFRGIAPVKNLVKRDFAVNGAIFTANNGYVFESCAHWISSYFLGDQMRLPCPENAMAITDKNAAWMRKRHPDMLLWANESYAASISFWNWPQAMDELLDDIGVASVRSGGNWLTWPFKVIDPTELSTLSEERHAKRCKM